MSKLLTPTLSHPLEEPQVGTKTGKLKSLSCSSAPFLPPQFNAVKVLPQAKPSIHLLLHYTITQEQHPEILEVLRLRQKLTPNPEETIHCFLAEHHGLRLGGAGSYPIHLAANRLSVCWRSHLMEPTQSHHLQKAGIRF